jgi:hypothetical protein
MLLQEVPVVESAAREQLEQLERDGFCPFCACFLNPGEKVCLDCQFDIVLKE